MQWTAVINELDNGQVCRLVIHEQDKQMSFSEVIENWKTSESFCRFYNQMLADIKFDAYFWEMPAMVTSRLAKPYECVCVNSPVLSAVKADSQPFSEYFMNECVSADIVQFYNLGRDAYLVAPCPTANNNAYSHLADFVRQAPQQQQVNFWKSVGVAYADRITDKPVWLSTSGLGVYWLHARMDNFPKYYTWQPYVMDKEL